MSLRLRVQTGTLAGRGFEFSGGPVRVGRRADLELVFDAHRELAVSGVHAELVEAPSGWVIRDLGSRNGTFVNGQAVPPGPGAPLADGDVLVFGRDGPSVVLSLAGSTQGRILALTRLKTRRLRWVAGTLGVGLLVAVGTLVYSHRVRDAGFEAERARLLAETEAVLRELSAANALAGSSGSGEEDPSAAPSPAPPSGDQESVATSPPAPAGGDDPTVQALSEALRESRAELEEIRDALARAPEGRGSAGGATGAETEAIERQLQEALAALRRQQLAGSLDLEAVQEGNRRAVALVFVESGAGVVSTGTAFSVRADGTLLTVRHLVQAEGSDLPPRRIAVQFSDSDQVWPARLVGVSEAVDLAAIRVEGVAGQLPVVRGFNTRPDTLGTGVAVASLGFPLGGSADPGSGLARPLVTAGVLSALRPDQLEIHGYGGVGASGSPVFDSGGLVVGVLFGGRPQGLEQVLLAVNAVQAARFLAAIPAGD